MKPCEFCGAKAQYQDRRTRQYVCLEHAHLEVVARRQGSILTPLAVRPATAADLSRITELALYFWDEIEVDCFDRQFDVRTCPAFVACDGDDLVGVASYALQEDWDAIVLVILNLLPGYQGRGAGWALLDALRTKAERCGVGRMLVVTSNDDLPALALYERYGFHITGILPGRIAEHHGGALPGFAGIPVRDEVRLECRLAEFPPPGFSPSGCA